METGREASAAIRIRPLEREDLKFVHGLDNNANVMRYWFEEPYEAFVELQDLYNKHIHDQSERRFIVDYEGQNVGLVAMTGVVNRRAIATGAVVLVLAGFVPVVSLVFASLPEAVLGGCTIMMFGNIIVSGFQMIANAGFSQRNITIAALSLAVGIGFTQMGDIFAIFPELVQSVFADNCVAVVFVVAILASLLLPKDQKVEGPLIVEEGNDSVDAAADALES